MSTQAQMEQMYELRNRTTSLRRHVINLSSQLSAGDKDRSIMTVTVSELGKLPASTRTFRAVGKMFALTPRDDLCDELEDAVEMSKKRDDGRVLLRDQFAGKLKEAEAAADQLAGQMQANPQFRKPVDGQPQIGGGE